MSAIDTRQMETALAQRIDKGAAERLEISKEQGGMHFSNMNQVMEFAKTMAIGSVAIPKHLRGNVGACLAVAIQATEWSMSPFAVANKSYVVNDRLSFEASMLHAVVQSRAPIEGRVKVEYSGEGATRKCTVWAKLKDNGERVDYTSPAIGMIKVKNSPLWNSDPDQQLFYFSVRSWCRRHFPDVLMGVYASDELEPEKTAAVTGTAIASAPSSSPFIDQVEGELEPTPAAKQSEPHPPEDNQARAADLDSEAVELTEKLPISGRAEWFNKNGTQEQRDTAMQMTETRPTSISTANSPAVIYAACVNLNKLVLSAKN